MKKINEISGSNENVKQNITAVPCKYSLLNYPLGPDTVTIVLIVDLVRCYENTSAWKTHYVQLEAVSVALKRSWFSRFTALSWDQNPAHCPEPGPNPSPATIRKYIFCVIFTE